MFACYSHLRSWLGQELIKNSRDSEQGVGKRLQMAFINLAEKQLTDAEKVTPILALALALALGRTRP